MENYPVNYFIRIGNYLNLLNVAEVMALYWLYGFLQNLLLMRNTALFILLTSNEMAFAEI